MTDKLTRRKFLHGVGMAAGSAAALSMVPAREAHAKSLNLTLGSSHSVNVPRTGQLKKYVRPEIDRRLKASGLDLNINWREAYGGVLYSFQATLEAIQDGLADMGWVGTIWEASKMPLQQVTYATPFTCDDASIMTEVMNDLHKEIPGMLDEWERYKTIFLGTTSTTAITLYTTFPIHKFEDLEGRKIVVAGAGANWLRNMGATGIDGGYPQFYEHIKTGLAEGCVATGTPGWSLKFYEVAPYVTICGVGCVHIGGLAANKDSFQAMPPELQAILRDVGREYSKRHALVDQKQADAAFEKMKAKGAKVFELPIEEQKKWAAALPDLAGEWADAAEKEGVPARKVVSAYIEGMRKRGQKVLRDWHA